LAAGSLAVLPFEAIGGDARGKDVADGITSELTTAMANVPGLRVASNASAIAIRNRLRGSADSAASAEVLMLLDGTVQRERNNLRVSVRLVRAATDSTMWAQTFNGVADSTFQMQTSVVQAVTAAVTRSVLTTR
jgi:TolB-like protein